MNSVLALDTSKSNTGWSLWDGQSRKPIFGSRRLGHPDKIIDGVRIKLTSDGVVFARIHELMTELRQLVKFDTVVMEAPLNPQVMSKFNDVSTPFLLYGIAAHVHSYCAALGLPAPTMVHQQSWRRTFLGPLKFGRKSKDLKDLTEDRCKQLGFDVRSDDEADAIGILDHHCEVTLGRLPPWREGEVLRPPLGISA